MAAMPRGGSHDWSVSICGSSLVWAGRVGWGGAACHFSHRRGLVSAEPYLCTGVTSVKFSKRNLLRNSWSCYATDWGIYLVVLRRKEILCDFNLDLLGI